MNKIDFYASEVHYFDHIIPVWNKLPEEYKGIFYVSEEVMKNRLSAKDNCEIGLPNDNITLVASYKDYAMTKGQVIFMEHGIGHNYGNKHSSYVGGRGKSRVVLFLNQHHLSQKTNREEYPRVEGRVIGTPKCDNISNIQFDFGIKKKVVCISFHWDCFVCNNTRSAYYHYKDILSELSKSNDYKLIAHGHPRSNWQEIKNLGIKFYDNLEDVMRIADVYVNDNSSSMYEFMLTGKPVVVLNCPLYDRDKNTGIRFWQYIGGIQVNEPSELNNAILETLRIDPYREIRKTIVEELYPFKGKSAQRASEVITEFLNAR